MGLMVSMVRYFILASVFFLQSWAQAAAIIDGDLQHQVSESVRRGAVNQPIPVLIFLHQAQDKSEVLNNLRQMPGVQFKELDFMPGIIATIPSSPTVLKKIANFPEIAQLSMNRPGQEEMVISTESMLLQPSPTEPAINNWWQHGYTGANGVLGLLDSGVASEHPGLTGKTIEIRQEPNSLYANYLNGVRTPHGTGVACIVAGVGSGTYAADKGVAFGLPTIVTGIAGEEDGTGGPEQDYLQTLSTLDWILMRATHHPTVINYSFGNGGVSCPNCPDWSGMAKVVDYVVNQQKILWAKSAGNEGWIAPKGSAPYASTMTIPADNYNGITVANMNPTHLVNGHPTPMSNRSIQTIRYTSSRGPTREGRRKPDLTAPGNDSRTCAPDPAIYGFQYKPEMDFQDGYRLMGGTSSAAPHVSGAILLLQEAGITDPTAIKALLINSADAWTDHSVPSPDDPAFTYLGGHSPVMGSHWDRTYGWGYINMEQAYLQRTQIKLDSVSVTKPIQKYKTYLPIGGKVTLVHERRVGYNTDNSEWKLSPLTLEIIDPQNHVLIDRDLSPIDSVHQVSNCHRRAAEHYCDAQTQAREVIIRITLKTQNIEGSSSEPFALVSSSPIQ